MASARHGRSTRTGSVAGVDAGRIGDELVWILAASKSTQGSPLDFDVCGSFGELWDKATARDFRVLAVDMPMGLPSPTSEWRQSDARARELLGEARRKTVFEPPPLCTIDAQDYDDANRLAVEAGGRTLSRGSYRLLQRCREVRGTIKPEAFASSAQCMVVEVLAEMCFWALNEEQPTRFEKRDWSGQQERIELLRPEFSNIEEAMKGAPQRFGPKLQWFDLFDAAAAAWTARRIASGTAQDLGEDGEVDEDGFPMSIWV